MGNTFIKDSKSPGGYEVPVPATLLSLLECTNGLPMASARTDSMGLGGGVGEGLCEVFDDGPGIEEKENEGQGSKLN